MKRLLILILLVAAGSFVAEYVRINYGINQTKSVKIHNGTMEIEAEQMLANLGQTCW
jgi:hypothetical protein